MVPDEGPTSGHSCSLMVIRPVFSPLTSGFGFDDVFCVVAGEAVSAEGELPVATWLLEEALAFAVLLTALA